MSVSIVTAVYGEYDDPKPLPPGLKADIVMVTDSRRTMRLAKMEGYRTVLLERPWLHSRMAAKLPRCRPDLFTGADVSIWLDGSMLIKDPSIVELAALATEDQPWWGWTHHCRDCFWDEAQVCVRHPKYPYPVMDQASFYASEGMPRHWGLWETGFMVRRHTRRVQLLGDDWYHECLRWGVQDQVSHPYVAWLHQLRPEQIQPQPASVFSNPWTHWCGHERND